MGAAITAGLIILGLFIFWQWLKRSASRREAKRFRSGKSRLVTVKSAAGQRGSLSPKRLRELRDAATRAYACEASGFTPDPADVRARNILERGGYDR